MKNKDPEMKEFAETEEQMNIEMVKQQCYTQKNFWIYYNTYLPFTGSLICEQLCCQIHANIHN